MIVQHHPKIDMIVAVAVAAGGATSATLHTFLETTQLVVSIAAMISSTGYIVWKWYRDVRHNKRRNRRASDAETDSQG